MLSREKYVYQYKERTIKMIQVGENLIINTDDEEDVSLASNSDHIVITCGLRLNSTITASSISDDGFTYCLQRTIHTLSGIPVTPQEFNIKWFKKPDDIFIPLAVVTMLILCDFDFSIFDTIRF